MGAKTHKSNDDRYALEADEPMKPLNVSLNPFFICKFGSGEYEDQVILRAKDRVEARKKALIVLKHHHREDRSDSNMLFQHLKTEEVSAIATNGLDGAIYTPTRKRKR